MKVDINYLKTEEDAQETELTFNVDEMNGTDKMEQCLQIITTFANEFDLDPELEVSDLEELVSDCKTENKKHFFILLSEEGLEVEI